MSGFIPREKLTAYQRWELADFDEPKPTPAPVEAPPAPPTPAEEAPVDAGEWVDASTMTLPTAEEIERIHSDAHAAGYTTGFDEGKLAGHEEGYQAGLALGHEKSTQLAAVMDELAQAMTRCDQELAEPLLTLAIEVARQVLRQSLQLSPELVLPTVREAIAALPSHLGHPTLFLNPADAALVRSQLADVLGHGGWQLIEDATVDAGGCRVEIGASEVDATLATRWRRVVETLGVSSDWLAARA
jgi:flagellar assembly protein FliH